MKIIGFSGKKQSGKDTAASHLHQTWYSKGPRISEIIRFADYLKQIVARCIFADEHWSDDYKDITIHGHTGRSWLQIIGTDWCRKKATEDFWVNATKIAIKRAGYSECAGLDVLVLVPDVRFPNEVKCIQELGGHVIRLLRAPFPEDEHESEIALDFLDDWYFYATNQSEWMKNPDFHVVCQKFGDINYEKLSFIDNREMTIEQQNEAIWTLVNEKGWI